MEDDDADGDLPLLANTRQVLVRHFELDLEVDLRGRTAEGTVVLSLEPAARDPGPGPDGSGEDFALVLDCRRLSVTAAEEVTEGCGPGDPPVGELPFSAGPWSLRIWKPGVPAAPGFPRHVRVRFRTGPRGRSLAWTVDQSGRPCVYTAGSPVNNRALFPCQDAPEALSTWGVTVHADAGLTVLTSGESEARPGPARGGRRSWYSRVTSPAPASTFALAVGSWARVEPPPRPPEPADLRWTDPAAGPPGEAAVPYRVFAPARLRAACARILLPLVAPCLAAARATLGPHPFRRLDLLLVPANFTGLGMASPHLIFLSQSVLSGGGHLCGPRLCHEVAHAWFGLAIGARDWTEEWLSEGFATHLEDVFWAEAQQLTPEEAQEQQDLKAAIRWIRLRDEVTNSQEEMQVLRPHREKTGRVDGSGASLIEHGLSREKSCLQVHYLKGYFLLRFLASQVGEATYWTFLRRFVDRFRGRLILSQDFLQMFLEEVPEGKRLGLSVESICQTWLDRPGLPEPLLAGSHPWATCRLVRRVSEEVARWIRFNGSPRKRKRAEAGGFAEELLADQVLLLLEGLLEEEAATLKGGTLRRLQQTYRLRQRDAEVVHRWCELVVKHRHVEAYGDVERFLRKHQALGVYLYAELMVGEDAKQQALARRCFRQLRRHMDPALASLVAHMIF
ncbi:aminopeptidase O [Ornithorhynchus anatinus]|uniref:aminopeptidase O n=1 Tax=Ornithorhynchus anatinus TaxID=9258 RepID=UPI0019D468A2|nr:aminopeptidase O [Ornithorhynchus anatinus]